MQHRLIPLIGTWLAAAVPRHSTLLVICFLHTTRLLNTCHVLHPTLQAVSCITCSVVRLHGHNLGLVRRPV